MASMMEAKYLEFFYSTVERVKKILSVEIPIERYDHSLIRGHHNALGICHGTADNYGKNWKPVKITIDNQFIEECYIMEYENGWWLKDLLRGKNLVSVLCHEIAHITVFRHGKRHSELSQQLFAKVNNAF